MRVSVVSCSNPAGHTPSSHPFQPLLTSLRQAGLPAGLCWAPVDALCNSCSCDWSLRERGGCSKPVWTKPAPFLRAAKGQDMAQKQGSPTHENKLSSRLRIRAWAWPSGDCGSLEAGSSGRSGPAAAPSMSQRSRRDFLWAWERSAGWPQEACLPTHCLQPPRGHIHQGERCVHIWSPNTMPAHSLPKQRHTTIILPACPVDWPCETQKDLPVRPSPPQCWPKAPLLTTKLGRRLHRPHTLPEWGSRLHGYLSPASSPSPLPKLNGGSYCLSAELTQTPHFTARAGREPPTLSRSTRSFSSSSSRRAAPISSCSRRFSCAHTRAAGGTDAALRPPPV